MGQRLPRGRSIKTLLYSNVFTHNLYVNTANVFQAAFVALFSFLFPASPSFSGVVTYTEKKKYNVYNHLCKLGIKKSHNDIRKRIHMQTTSTPDIPPTVRLHPLGSYTVTLKHYSTISWPETHPHIHEE